MSKIRLGLPSKGRLKDESIKMFSLKNLNIQNTNSRNYFFNFEESSKFDGIFLHAREIIERINDGTLDAGVSGLDLLMELPDEYQNNIKILKKLNFGFADLVVAVPNDWLDVQNIADLEEVSFEFKEKYNRRMRVATKYPNISKEFFAKRGIQVDAIKLNGSMELAPSLNMCRRIVDLVSTGATLKANGLKEIEEIMKIQSKLIINRSAFKTDNNKIQSIINEFKDLVE